MVSIQEIATQLNIPATTARDYVRRFKGFFITKQVAGKRFPLYLDNAKDILQDIVMGYKKGLSTDEINEELRTKYGYFVENEDDEEQRTQSNNGGMTTAKSSIDIVTSLQVQQFQWLQRQSEFLEKQQQLMERQTELLEKITSLLEGKKRKGLDVARGEKSSSKGNVEGKKGKENKKDKGKKNNKETTKTMKRRRGIFGLFKK